jgi:hypothetical protein
VDSIILDLNPEGVTLNVAMSGVENKVYVIAVTDVPANTGNRIYFQREVHGESQVIINLPKHSREVVLKVTAGKIGNVWQSKLKPPKIPYQDLAEYSRPYRFEDIIVRADYTISSPACIYKELPVILYNPKLMEEMTEPTKVFVIDHEFGHLFHTDEQKADRWALVTFLNEGYSLSSAIYALTMVLGVSKENVERMVAQHELLKEISLKYYG